ncbi:MAG: tetratricopeptide repeat protein, partial [Parvibaculaceae bacterium]
MSALGGKQTFAELHCDGPGTWVFLTRGGAIMHIRQASMTGALIWLSSLGTPVAAQTFEQQLAQCNNMGEQVASAVRITACTALLQSGRLNSQQLSILRVLRGFAYAAQNDHVRAIADYSEAIRLNPQYVEEYNYRSVSYRAQYDNVRAIADQSASIRLIPEDARP